MRAQRVRDAVCILGFILLMPPVTLAGWIDFIPRPYDNGADIRFLASHESEENRASISALDWDDTFLREKLTIFSKGYSYHPLFLQYHLSFTGGLKQERYASTFFESTGYDSDSAIEYNARVYLLPEHKYNLEVFSRRFEPLFRDRAANDSDALQTSHGALFRYRKKPVFLNAKFVDNTVESSTTVTDVQSVTAGASYFKDFGNSRIFSITGNYNRPNFSNSLGLEGHSEEVFATSQIRNRWLSFRSNFTRGTAEQQNPLSGVLDSSQFSFLEQMNARLPYRLEADAFYRYQKSENTITGRTGQEDFRTNTRRELQAGVLHKLYDSLNSRYTFRQSNSKSAGGESTNLSHYVNVNYINRTRLGRLLAGMHAGRVETESGGVTSIVNEPHASIEVPGSFLLNEIQLVDPDTIEVFLESPIPPNDIVRLQEGVHYAVIPEANSFRIDVLALPPEFVLPGRFDFLVTYSLQRGNFELQTDNYGYNISYDLFSMIEPYHSYSRTIPEVTSGNFPGTRFDSSTIVGGLLFHKAGFRLLGEYSRLDWDVSPYTAYRAEARYSGGLSRTTRINLSAEYLNKDFPEGSAQRRDLSYTEERSSFSASIQKHFFRRRFLLATGGSYSMFSGLTEGNAYSWNSTLSWRIALLEFTLGASLFHTDSVGFGTSLQDRDHHYYFLNVARKLF